MKLAVLGDLHIISPQDPFPEAHERRAHFAQTASALQSVQRLVRREAPDLVISVGDLTDWYSDENRDEAVGFLNALGVPWLLTPGNHDIASYVRENDEVVGPFTTPEIERTAREGWAAADVPIDNRVVDIGSTRLLLLDSSPSELPEETQTWLAERLKENADRTDDARAMLFTHKPFNIEPIWEFVTSVEPGRDPYKSLQKGMPDITEELLVVGLDMIFSGHLHFFPGYAAANGLDMHLLPLSVVSAGRVYPRQGTVTFVQSDGSAFHQIQLDQAH